MPHKAFPSSPPLFPLQHVVHIGTLDAAHKGWDSYEGDGLSVSVHPDAWEAIARLGGQPRWGADVSSLRFLDGHRFVRGRAHALEEWGAQHGWIEPATLHEVSWVDAETEDRTFALFLDADDAQEEVAMHEDQDEPCSVRQLKGFVPTPAFCTALRQRPHHALQPCVSLHDDLATIWAQQHGLEGVWWADRLDEAALSAPRGVVFPAHVPRVTWEPVETPAPGRRRAPR